MNKKSPFIRYLINFLIFVILETVAIMLVLKNSIVQKSEMMNIVNTVNGSAAKAVDNVFSYFSLKKVNNRLSEENGRLKEDNQALKEMIVEHMIPDRIDSPQSSYIFIPAKIISNSTDRLHNILIINKGEEDGIREGMGVITDKGVVGHIVQSTRHYSKITSLLDTDNSISAIIKKNNAFGILKWKGESVYHTTLNDIPIHTAFQEGDTVVSSGYSAVYPANIPIGTITGNFTDDGTNYDIEIEFLENFKSLKYVYVVKVKDLEEIESLMKEKEDEA